MSTRKPWPKDGLYINELIDTLVDYYEKPDTRVSLRDNGWQVNMKNKLLTLKQAAANAKITTTDDLTNYLYERY